MARRITRVSITDEGRDKGKLFVLTEMSASQAEWWATRALKALAGSGIVEVPQTAIDAGFAAVAAFGLRLLGNMDLSLARELLDEMFSCVQRQPGKDERIVRPLIEDDIEEVATRIKLRVEVFNLHAGFSIAASLSKSPEIPAAPEQTSATPVVRMSHSTSKPLSRSVRPRSTS